MIRVFYVLQTNHDFKKETPRIKFKSNEEYILMKAFSEK